MKGSHLIVPAQIGFVTNAKDKVTTLVLHQPGLLQRANKVAPRVAERGEAALAERIKKKIPSPGTEAAVRHQIAALKGGQWDYSAMAVPLAAIALEQNAVVASLIHHAGAFRSLAFKGVALGGLDIYDATSSHGQLEFRIAPLGKNAKFKLSAFVHCHDAVN